MPTGLILEDPRNNVVYARNYLQNPMNDGAPTSQEEEDLWNLRHLNEASQPMESDQD